MENLTLKNFLICVMILLSLSVVTISYKYPIYAGAVFGAIIIVFLVIAVQVYADRRAMNMAEKWAKIYGSDKPRKEDNGLLEILLNDKIKQMQSSQNEASNMPPMLSPPDVYNMPSANMPTIEVSENSKD